MLSLIQSVLKKEQENKRVAILFLTLFENTKNIHGSVSGCASTNLNKGQYKIQENWGKRGKE